MMAFGGLCIVLTILLYMWLEDPVTGLVLLLLAGLGMAVRLSVLAQAGRATGVTERLHAERGVIATGLCWAAIVAITGSAGALSGNTILLTLSALVVTGLTFGMAFANAGAPMFARVQVTLTLVLFVIAIAFSGVPGIRLVALQGPLWLVGIFSIIGRSHRLLAELARSHQTNRVLAFSDLDRPRQSRPDHEDPHRPVRHARPAGYPLDLSPLSRPGRVQGGQRQLRARRRRSSAVRDGRALPRGGAFRRRHRRGSAETSSSSSWSM